MPEKQKNISRNEKPADDFTRIENIDDEIKIRVAKPNDTHHICKLRELMWRKIYTQKAYAQAILAQDFTSKAVLARFGESIESGNDWLARTGDAYSQMYVDNNNNGDKSVEKPLRVQPEAKSAVMQHIHWVAQYHDKIIGWAACAPRDNEIIALYILPDFQGKGLGTKLYRLMLNQLNRTKNIIIYAVVGNQYAVRFYQKQGFQIIASPSEAEILAGLKKNQLPLLTMCLPRKSP